MFQTGIMEWWNNSISCISCQGEKSRKTRGPHRLRRRRLFARRVEKKSFCGYNDMHKMKKLKKKNEKIALTHKRL
jgi:hypothetical protein